MEPNPQHPFLKLRCRSDRAHFSKLWGQNGGPELEQLW